MARTWSVVLFEWSEVQVVCILGDETIRKCLYNLFLAVQQIRRATLGGFSETNGVVYAKFHKSIIRITVLYELIKGITVLYMPNQAHNCTVWLIQYSYATFWAIQHTFSLWSSHAKYNIITIKNYYDCLTVAMHVAKFSIQQYSYRELLTKYDKHDKLLKKSQTYWVAIAIVLKQAFHHLALAEHLPAVAISARD